MSITDRNFQKKTSNYVASKLNSHLVARKNCAVNNYRAKSK